MKHLRIAACALGAIGLSPSLHADPAATLLFAQQGTQIVAASGTTRDAHRGDVLQTGERLRTPPGAISQVLLPDGSLIGLRADSELKIDTAAPSAGSQAPVVSLLVGSARLIGSELMDPKRASNVTLQSGVATLRLKAADLESAVVKPDGKPTPGEGAAGSYQRLLVGNASLSNGSFTGSLTPKQLSFVAAANAGPQALGSNANNPLTAQRPANALTHLTPPKLLAPVQLPVITPTTRPCTRFIGKTCIQ